jgi:hypothetical protein
MLFAALVGLSVVSCFSGFELEVVERNIRHVQNGRKPNAGFALLPTIPVVPVAYCCVAWGLNLLRPNLGFMIVASYAVVIMAVRCVQISKARRNLRKLVAHPPLTAG